MCFVKEKHQLGLRQIAHFRQRLEQFRQHPQQEGRVQTRRGHEFVGSQDIDHAVTAIGLHEVGDVQHRLAEELFAALLIDQEQATLDGADAGGADIAVFSGELTGVFADELQHGAQVFQIQKREPVIVGNLEHQIQHALLGLVQRQHARQQQRPHVADRGPHRMSLRAEHIPQCGRAGAWGGGIELALGENAGELGADGAGLADAGQVAFHIGHEHRHADAAEVLGEGLQGDGLAGASGAGDEAVTIGQRRQQTAGGLAALRDEERVGHGELRSDPGLQSIQVAARPRDSLPHSSVKAEPLRRMHFQSPCCAMMWIDEIVVFTRHDHRWHA